MEKGLALVSSKSGCIYDIYMYDLVHRSAVIAYCPTLVFNAVSLFHSSVAKSSALLASLLVSCHAIRALCFL